MARAPSTNDIRGTTLSEKLSNSEKFDYFMQTRVVQSLQHEKSKNKEKRKKEKKEKKIVNPWQFVILQI
jgi:hypothetical protein